MYHSRTYSLEPWLSKKNISSRVMLYLSVKTVVNLKHWLCECKPTSFQITVSKTEKLPVNILRKTKMEQNNEIKHIFYSKYTVSWNWFAQRRKQKVSWRTSDYHGKQEARNGSAHCFQGQCSCSGILPVTRKALTSHTKLRSCEILQHTVTGIYSYLLFVLDVHSDNGRVKIFVWQQQKCGNKQL